MTKHTRDLTTTAGRRPERFAIPRPMVCPETEIPDELADRIECLFVDLKGVFAGWRATWANPEIENSAKRQWALTLIEQRVTQQEQLDAGLARCRQIRSQYLIPASEFADLCKPRPEDYGFLPVDAAFALALRAAHPSGGGRCSNPVVLEAVREVGAYLLFHGNEDTSRARFAAAYSHAVCRILAGGQPLDVAAPPLLEAPRRTKAAGRAALDELRASLGGRRRAPAEDPPA